VTAIDFFWFKDADALNRFASRLFEKIFATLRRGGDALTL
jgi:hypothetical protein